MAVDQRAERPAGEVLGKCRRRRRRPRAGRAGTDGRARTWRRRPRRWQMERRAGDRPGAAAGDELAEQLHVVVARSEDALVERLLGGPDSRGERAGERAVHGASKLHSPIERNAPPRDGYLSRCRAPRHEPVLVRLSSTTSARAVAASTRSSTGRRACPEARHPDLLPPGAPRPRSHSQTGGVILAANHRSFLDPFLIGCCLGRPIYFVAKRELFQKPLTRLVPQLHGGVPDPARRVRRGVDGDRAGAARARRGGRDLPRGHAHPQRLAGAAQARRRPPGARDRRAGRADRRSRAASTSATAG